jgi:hypothetical protein
MIQLSITMQLQSWTQLVQCGNQYTYNQNSSSSDIIISDCHLKPKTAGISAFRGEGMGQRQNFHIEKILVANVCPKVPGVTVSIYNFKF